MWTSSLGQADVACSLCHFHFWRKVNRSWLAELDGVLSYRDCSCRPAGHPRDKPTYNKRSCCCSSVNLLEIFFHLVFTIGCQKTRNIEKTWNFDLGYSYFSAVLTPSSCLPPFDHWQLILFHPENGRNRKRTFASHPPNPPGSLRPFPSASLHYSRDLPSLPVPPTQRLLL